MSVTDSSTPALVREFASLRVEGALRPSAAKHARLGVVVEELRRRGALD